MKYFLAFVLAFLSPAIFADEITGPDVSGQVLEYSTGGNTYQGYLAYNSGDKELRPGILLIPDGQGLGAFVKARADQLAALGFVALAVDMYGDGKVAKDAIEAQDLSSKVLQDWPAARARLEAAMDILRKQPMIKDERMAAMGYGFGGSVVMNMALAGMPIDAALSFYGLPVTMVSKPQKFSGEVRLYNGQEDSLVDPVELTQMAKALEENGANVRVIQYPRTMHSFANGHIDELSNEAELPLSYSPASDAASWQSALLVLDKALNQ